MDGKEDVNEIASTQKSLSSQHDPGWNDPPKWAFTPTQSEDATKTPTKRLLNRRVAFPLSAASTAQNSDAERPAASPSFPGNLPPPPCGATSRTTAPHAPLLAPSVTESQASCIEIDKHRALEETLKNLETVINNELANDARTEEVKRRLETMQIMWKEDKMKDGVQKKILEISKALRNGDAEGADKIHVSLIMEHASVCSTWISGIRHMILALREKSSQTISAPTTEGHPYLLPRPVGVQDNE